MARQTSRDLFDAHALLHQPNLDRKRLRLGFVVYGGMNRKDWRTISVDDLSRTSQDLESYLLPLLRPSALPSPFDLNDWAKTLIQECTQAMRIVLPFELQEQEFLNRLLDEGEIVPELLTEDVVLQERIRKHPDLAWKALNVHQFKKKASL